MISAVIILVRLAIGSARRGLSCQSTRPVRMSNSSPAFGGCFSRTRTAVGGAAGWTVSRLRGGGRVPRSPVSGLGSSATPATRLAPPLSRESATSAAPAQAAITISAPSASRPFT